MSKPSDSARSSGESAKKDAFEQRRNESREIRRLKHRLEFLEAEIGRIESGMKELEKVLSNPTAETDIMELTRDYLERKRELDQKTSEWESVMERLEE